MDDGSLLRILVVTDIHLGKHENHPIRGVDSFEAFSKVKQVAKSTKPDILMRFVGSVRQYQSFYEGSV